MSDPFDSDPIGSMTSNNQLLPPVSGQEQEDILSQQVISTGGQENPYSGSLPLTSAEDQFILGQSVATLEAQSVSANNSDADILTGETREASQLFSHIVGGTLDIFSGDPYQAGGPGPLLVNDTANKLYEWQGGVHRWIPSSRLPSPSPVNINQALDSDPNFSAVGEVNLGSNTRYIPGVIEDNRNGINTGDWGWGPVNGDYRLPPDYFVVKGYTETYLEGGQTYRFEAKGDDGYQIWLKNLGTDEWYWVTPENQWQSTVGEQGTDVFNYTIPVDKGGQYYVGFFHYEVDQEAYFGLNWTEAPTYQAPSYQAPSSGVSSEAQRILNAIDQVNPEQLYYEKKDIAGPGGVPDGIDETFCNWFAADVLEVLGIPLPRDSAQPYKMNPPVFGGQQRDKPINADRLYDHFNGSGEWQAVNPSDAAALANNGQVVVASSPAPAPRTSGHIAIVRPGSSEYDIRIAQAGWFTKKDMSVGEGFGDSIHSTSFFVYVG